MAKHEKREERGSKERKTGKKGERGGPANGKRETLHVALLVDESGSMAPLHGAVIAGVNEFIAEMKVDPSPDTRTLVSLAMFDARGGEPPVRVRFSDLPLEKVKPIGPSQYAPHGATPLNDAVRKTIKALERAARPAKKGGRPDRVMIVVLTDGLENASETSSGDLQKLILAKEAEGWEFLYLGANQDTWAATAGIGLDRRGKHMAWEASSAGVSAAMRVSGERAKRFRDAPEEYELESKMLSDRIEPGDVKARLLSESERRRGGRSGR
ncbi:MAG: vWA domain-containing protein [Solirubrobacterales bacterium]